MLEIIANPIINTEAGFYSMGIGLEDWKEY